jgi:hypothetical protein
VIEKIDDPRTSTRRTRMIASDLKFVIFRDMKDGYYRWRLRSATGETVELSE